MEKTYSISKKIYSKQKIKEAIEAFRDVSDIKYKITSSELTIKGESESDIEDIFNELGNYIIYLEC